MDRARSRTLALFALACATPALRADGSTYSAQLSLQTRSVTPAGTTTFEVRSPLAGSFVALLADSGLDLWDLGAGLPLLNLSQSAMLMASAAMPAGTLTLGFATPALGTTFSVQALLLPPGGGGHASSPLTVTVGQSDGPLYGLAGLPSETADQSATDVDLADLDFDGCPDAVVTNDGEDAFPLVLIGACSGGFSYEGTNLPAAAQRPTACVAIGDVNGDQLPDLFLGGGFGASAPAPNLLLLNDGTGSFYFGLPALAQHPGGPFLDLVPGCLVGTCPVASVPAGRGTPLDAVFGDADGDGDLDLFVLSRQDFDHPAETPDPLTLYLNQGGLQGGRQGVFLEGFSFPTTPPTVPHTSSGSLAVGDLDGDGDLDVFLCGAGIQNRVFVNDGSAGFSEALAALPAEVDDSFDVAMGDFDADGDLDLFVANNLFTDTTGHNLLENRTTVAGLPAFVDASSDLPGSFGPVTSVRIAADAGDFDGDGDLDILCGIHELPGMMGPTDGESVLLVNQGGAQGGTTGLFAVDTTFLPGKFIVADVALEDIDRDGDLDLYLANSGNLFQFDFHDELWLNQQ